MQEARGSATVVLLAFMGLFSVLAAVSLFSAGADLAVARRDVERTAGIYAAEGAFEEAVRDLSEEEPPLVGDDIFLNPPPEWTLGPRAVTVGGWTCRWRGSFIGDVGDRDGNLETGTVLFNRRFGYGASPLDEGGFPVVGVTVEARRGAAVGVLVAEVAPVTLDPLVPAAWSAGGDLAIGGPVTLSRDGGDLPLLSTPGAVTWDPEVRLEGGGPLVAPDAEEIPVDPLEVLNGGGTLTATASLPSPPAFGEPLCGIRFSPVSFRAPLDGAGVLVVHNPRFDPRAWEASRRALEEGVFGEDFDPGYSHLDPANRPAVADLFWGGGYAGLIVADVVAPPMRPFTLAGALVTLSRSPQDFSAGAPVRVVHSAAALRRSARGPLRFVAAVDPLAAVPEDFE